MRILNRPIIWTLLLCFVFSLAFIPAVQAASLDNNTSSGGLFTNLLQFLYEKILSPIFQLLHPTDVPAANQGSPSKSTGSLPTVPSPSPNTGSGLSGKKILLDPGHGGSNPGAVDNGTRESDNNLAVALLTAQKLRQAGSEVLLTRSTDQTVAPEGSSLTQELQARVDKAEAFQADVFVSIHTNQNPNSSITGLSTYYNKDDSKNLAVKIQQAVLQATGANDKNVLKDNFYVIRTPAMPSVLIEMGFISNPDEAQRLSNATYREKIAQGIVNGLNQYFQ